MAAIIRSLHPDLKRSIKAAIRAIAADPACSEPLCRELDGLTTYRVRRFWIIYAVGHRRSIYEKLMERIWKKG